MFLFIVTIACLLAVIIGYFFNIYVVLTLGALLSYLYTKESCRPNPYPGTSGRMGAMIMGFIVLAPFVIIMLITSIIRNQDKVATFFKTVAYYFPMVFLR